MYQRLKLAGRVGKDPELRYTPSGRAVTRFSVATTRRWRQSDGELKQETAWFQIIALDKLAEICAQRLVKGEQVFVEGELMADEKTGGPHLFKRKGGEMGAVFEVHAMTVRFLDEVYSSDAGWNTTLAQAKRVGGGFGGVW